jgi:triosephosphate isomerase
MRKKMVAGNWKMHASRSDAESLLQSIKEGNPSTSLDVVVIPPFVHLPLAEKILQTTPIAWGAQNLYIGDSGAFTGEISGPMLADYGCQYVLVGHSERRMLFHEDETLVAAKCKAALHAGLTPILCVGETREEREKNKTEEVIKTQLDAVFKTINSDELKRLVIAYEPVWAIGTGLTATPAEAEVVHAFIRNEIAKYGLEVADSMRILYGGSVKADNARGLFAMPDIDGGLIGGASLKADNFLAICQAALTDLPL